MSKTFLEIVIVFSILASCTTAAPAFGTKRWTRSVVMVLQDILVHQFPLCDIILLQDSYFAENMNGWLTSIKFPYYSITLDGKPFPDYTTWQKITKTTGFLCTTVIAACVTFETCRNSDSPTLFKMLSANGILLKERRALLYIDQYSVEDSVPYSLSKLSDKWSVTHETPNRNGFSLNVLNKAKNILNELMTHITIIRDVTGQLDHKNSNLRNTTEDPDTKDIQYETLTFSPNWVPGGTPVVPNLWSKRRGFMRPYLAKLNLTHIRPGGIVKFCVYSKHLLPFIDVAANGTIRGLEAEIIGVFGRHLKIQAQFFEPKDREGGQRDHNGNWSGQIGYVFRKEADIGLGHVILTHDKIEAGLKFSPPVVTLKAIVVCPIPQLLPRYQTLAYPFDTPTWICLLVSFIVSVMVIDILQRVTIKLMPLRIDTTVPNCQPGITIAEIKVYSTCKDTMLPWIQSIGPIFLRSISISMIPRRWAVLILFSVWLLFTFITAAVYVTILIGALSAPPKEGYVNSPADLVQIKSKWAILPVVSQAIENSTLPVEVALLKKAKSIKDMPEYQNLAPDVQVYSYVNTTGNCGVSEEYRTKFYIGKTFNLIDKNHKRQRLYVSKGSFFVGATGWVIRNDIDFLIEQYFDKMFLDMACYGFHQKLIQDWFPKRYKVDEPIEPLNFETVKIVFVFGASGLFLSCFVFLMELLTNRVNVGVSAVRSHWIQARFEKTE